MKIIREDVIIGNIEHFAHIYCLEMIVRKVHRSVGPDTVCEYYASFKNVNIQTNAGTAFIQGHGYTEEESIRNYARHIRLHKMVTEKGAHIYVWDLT